MQGSQNRWEPVRFPTPKPSIQILESGKPVGLTGKPPGFFDSWVPLPGGFVNPAHMLSC
jgi:hypothetical protein